MIEPFVESPDSFLSKFLLEAIMLDAFYFITFLSLIFGWAYRVFLIHTNEVSMNFIDKTFAVAFPILSLCMFYITFQRAYIDENSTFLAVMANSLILVAYRLFNLQQKTFQEVKIRQELY